MAAKGTRQFTSPAASLACLAFVDFDAASTGSSPFVTAAAAGIVVASVGPSALVVVAASARAHRNCTQVPPLRYPEGSESMSLERSLAFY